MALALVLVAVAGCSGDDPGSEIAAVTTTAPGAIGTSSTGTGSPGGGVTDPSTGTTEPTGGGGPCPTAPSDADENGIISRSLEAGGLDRDYLVDLPRGYRGDEPVPAVFAFHGAGSNKEEQLVYSRFGDLAERDGWLLVYPDALGDPARWSPLGMQTEADDLAFFDALLQAVEEELCVDTERVYATGMSSGGFMSTVLACRRSDVIAAVGPVTATAYTDQLCGDALPVPWVYFHGTDDPVVPFLGPQPGPDGAPGPGSVEGSAESWAAHNGCDPEPTEERIGTEVVHRSWEGCVAPTDLYIVEGGGHTWPGSMDVASLGYTTDEIDASEIIWERFAASSRPQ